MQYARITRLHSIPGRETEVEELLERYLGWLKEREGFVLGICLTSDRHAEERARFIVWETRGDADATALSEHALAVRSHLLALTRDQTIHEEEFLVRSLALPIRPRLTQKT